MGLRIDGKGFDEFEKLVGKYLKKMSGDGVVQILKKGADSLVDDVRMLPSPRSVTGHPTHMLDTISAQPADRKVQVGWAARYGRFVEYGTRKMSPRAHLNPTYQSNQDKYIRLMADEFTRL